MSRTKKIWIGAGVLAVLGFLAWRALAAGSGDSVDVRAAEVGHRDLVARVTATGHIEPKRSVDISADVSGRIVELPVDEGQSVEEGDLLLRIDPARFEAAVRQARARLSEARANEAQRRADYEQAMREWDRLRTLKERTPDLVTDQEAEQTETRAEVARATWQAAEYGVEQAEAALQEAEDQLDKTVIRAPMSGLVTRLNVERGETAVVGTMNNPGSLLATVADLEVMEAVIEVDETDVTQVSLGDSALVQIDAFPDTAFTGRVTKIGNSSIRPRTSTTGSQDQAIDFEVRITLADPPRGIRPDLSATADIITAIRRDVLAIPIIALTLEPLDELPEGWRDSVPEGVEVEGAEDVEGVFLVRGETARFRPVRVGITGDNDFEVLAGLSSGDTVVSGSYQAIRELTDGDRLEIQDVEPSENLGEEGTAEVPDSSGEAGAGSPDGASEPDEGNEGEAAEEPPARTGDRPPAAAASTAEAAADARGTGDGEPGAPFYAVVVSARDSGAVRALLADLEAAGYDTSVRRHRDDGGNTWYRGLVGPYGARAEAEADARRLREDHDLDVWVAGAGTLAEDGPGGSTPEA